MQKQYKHILCLALFLLSLLMHGQGLPSLGIANEISKGSLPNGLTYYIVTNTAEKGSADFCLVQKQKADVIRDRKLLSSLPHFGDVKPYKFLSGHGVGYSESGYVSYPLDATVFSFKNVPASVQTLSDSTLLMIFDMAASSLHPQAIVVSGDINADRIKERMNLLSMMVPRLDRTRDNSNYSWHPRDSVNFLISRNSTSDLASINVIYSIQRLPRGLMNTTQPIVSRTYAGQLGRIISRRVAMSFRDCSIPLAAVRSRYQDSSEGPGDEFYSITVYTSARYITEATSVLSSVLSSLDGSGAAMSEFKDSKGKVIAEFRREGAASSVSNADYTDKCISSYLYGSNLASAPTVSDFVTSRKMPEDRGLELFNGFVKALLDSSRNMTLRYDTPRKGGDGKMLRKAFGDSWARPEKLEIPSVETMGDTLGLSVPKVQVRLRSETKEPISGGKLWTFSNGIRVVYKQTPLKGEFRYAMMLRGGVASVPGLGRGESAFVGDMLSLSNVAGMSGDDFHSMLDANGVTMETSGTPSHLEISGISQTSKLPLLMRSLLSLANGRQLDKEAFDYYRRSEPLRIAMRTLAPRDVNALMDSIMRPDYQYDGRKFINNLGSDLQVRAEKYFAAEFSKVNDGLLIFTGDIDEDVLKKELCRTLGGFSTQKAVYARSGVSSRLATGSVTYTTDSAPGLVGGLETSVNVSMSSVVPYNISNYMSFNVACELLKKKFARLLAPYGAYSEISSHLELSPAERLSLFINCRPCSRDALPYEVSPSDPYKLLDGVRTITSSLGSISISDDELKASKAVVLARYDARRTDAESIMDDVIARYSDGKDLVSGYREAVNAVSAVSVRKILSLLASGAEVEYIII